MKHGRSAIRIAIKTTWLFNSKNYKVTAEETGLSTGTLWRLINKRGFWPKSPMVKNQIKRFGKRHGIVVGVRPLPKI